VVLIAKEKNYEEKQHSEKTRLRLPRRAANRRWCSLPYALRASGNRHSVSQFYAEFAENVPTFSPLGELGGKLPARAPCQL